MAQPIQAVQIYYEHPFGAEREVLKALFLYTDDHSITERAKWFVSASITASCGDYEAFTDELNRHIRTDFIIRLPVDKTGQPDWAYMEEYMRKVEEKTENTLNQFMLV